MAEDWDEWDEYEEEEYDPVTAALESGDLPCEHGYCGPECPYWMGDGLCELAIEEQARETEDYEKKHHRKAKCPVCGKELDEYDVKADKLWVWDAGWYNPLIGLAIYGPMGVPKGVIHSKDNVYHIYVGEGENRNEKLVRLIGRKRL